MKQVILDSIAETFSVIEHSDGCRVTTQLLYPSNAFVQVRVRGGENTFYVSDDGGAVQEIESAGAFVTREDRLLRSIVKPLGLEIFKGVIRLQGCDQRSLGIAIALVANASKTAAEYLYAHLRIRPIEKFKETVYAFLREKYQKSVQEESFVGHSNKAHKFENVIVLSDRKRLVIDPVTKDPGSINARVVANMDLKAANYPDLEQRIVYDDRDRWKAEDLNLLQVGAPVFAYSRARDVLERIALQ